MRASAFWRAVTVDETNLLARFLDVLRNMGAHYCVVGGQAVNAYVDPVVSLDLDIVVAVEQLQSLESKLAREFRVERFPHSLNVSAPGSDLRVQIQTDPRYAGFVARATERVILGRSLVTAAIDDVMQGKVWAAQDQTRRPSKRQKDLADIARLLEAYPELRLKVPDDVLARLVS
jgi:hypothetical protein